MSVPRPLKLLLVADPSTDLSALQNGFGQIGAIFLLTRAADASPLSQSPPFDALVLHGSDKLPEALRLRREHPGLAVLLLTDGPAPRTSDGVRVVDRSTLSPDRLAEEVTAAIMAASEKPASNTGRLRRRPLHVQLGNEDIYEELVETMNEGVLTVDPDGTVTYANRRVEDLLGSARGSLLGRELKELLSAADAEVFRSAAPRGKYDLALRDTAREPRAFLVSQSPLTGPEGRSLGRLLVLSDVTEMRDYQQRLIQSEKMVTLGELLASVAHELNNPLCTIMGYSQLLRGKEVGEELARMLEKIADGAARCNRIVQGLLSFSRRKKPEKTYVGINGILREVVNILAYDLKTHNVIVELSLDDLLPKTMADFHQLQQVFLNILSNGRQALYDHKRGGTIVLRTLQKGGRLRVEIEDNGPGVPEELRTRIFDPFFTTKEAGRGTGLGLSISYGIIHEHGGQVWVEEARGGGARFVVELPIVRGPGGKSPDKPAGDSTRLFPVLAKRNFLVVDDEPTLVDLLHTFLTQQGARVDTASSGTIGLQKILRQDYDAVICDLRMPGLSGDELFHNLEEVKPAMMKRFLFITGDILTEETRTFLEKSGAAYIMKPFYLKDAARQLQRILSGKGPEA